MSSASTPSSVSLIDYFQDLEDPRMDRRKDHPLINVLFIAICAVLSGAEGWKSIETFGQAKQWAGQAMGRPSDGQAKREWLARYLKRPEGPHPVPSDDTYRRTIGRLDPEGFAASFREWVAAVASRVNGEVIALDGKAVRGSYDRDAATIAANGAPKSRSIS